MTTETVMERLTRKKVEQQAILAAAVVKARTMQPMFTSTTMERFADALDSGTINPATGENDPPGTSWQRFQDRAWEDEGITARERWSVRHRHHAGCTSCGGTGWAHVVSPDGALALCRCQNCDHWVECLTEQADRYAKDRTYRKQLDFRVAHDSSDWLFKRIQTEGRAKRDRGTTEAKAF